jgi:hypothetical protein
MQIARRSVSSCECRERDHCERREQHADRERSDAYRIPTQARFANSVK